MVQKAVRLTYTQPGGHGFRVSGADHAAIEERIVIIQEFVMSESTRLQDERTGWRARAELIQHFGLGTNWGLQTIMIYQLWERFGDGGLGWLDLRPPEVLHLSTLISFTFE